MRTIAAFTAATLLATSDAVWAALPWAPEPEQVPEVHVDGQSVVVNLTWDYPRHCFELVGFNWIAPGDQSTSGTHTLTGSLNYGFFGSPSGCPNGQGDRWVGSRQYRWNNLAPGTYNVKVSYVDGSSFLDCSLLPQGCPAPQVTRVFDFEVVVSPLAVPAYTVAWMAILVLLVGASGGSASVRQRSLQLTTTKSAART